MSEAEPLLSAAARAADRVCHLMWLFMRQEPEVLALVEERHTMGFPHYLTSRMGVIPPQRWADEVFIVPSSLIEHLRPRCERLNPPEYVDAALNAAGRALARLAPQAPTAALRELADLVEAQGALVSSWARWHRSGDDHGDAVRDAMVLREDRAHGHYEAAREAQLAPLQLMVLTQAWRGGDLTVLSGTFRWGEEAVEEAQASLRERGLLTQSGTITDVGRALRDQIEESTNRWAGRYRGRVDESRRGGLAAELERLGAL